MKKLLLSLLDLGAVGCRQQAAPAATANAPATGQPPVAGPVPVTTPADSTAAVLALMRQVDLSPAWNGSSEAAMEGFYGPDNYRMSFHIDSVQQNKAQPNVYYFQGRDRYKKGITPFAGTLTVTRLAFLPDTGGIEHYNGERAFTAFASLALREDPAAKGAGHCTGRAVLDFQVNARNRAVEAGFTGIGLGENNPTQGCGQIFRGTWQSNRTGQRQPVAWANSYSVIVPAVLAELGLNERMEEVNPKLAKYGWNTVMENDEWWASSPRPKLNL